MPDFSDETVNNDEEESFAELLKSYGMTASEDLAVGDKIHAEIIAITNDRVFVSTGSKTDGFVDKAELLNERGEMTYAVGDMLDLFVISVGENTIELSAGLSGVGGLMHLEDAWKNSRPVEGTVKEQIKGGFNVMVMGKRAFCPISQIDMRYIENPAEYIGNTYRFLVTRFEEKGRNIVVSRRDILQEEAEKANDAFYQRTHIGTVLSGKVTRIEPYGVFVELMPAIEGMVHVSELGWSKTITPKDLLNVGDSIQVKLVGMERSGKSNKLKLSLSVKQLTGDPWDRAEDTIKPGDKLTGKVTRCADFGAFVEISPGIEGLIHISEMSYTKRVLKPEDVLAEGDSVSVIVREIDFKRRRISLSLRDAQGDPWMDVPGKYAIGKIVEGIVEKKANFGLFIRLEPGITGLLPKSKITDSYAAASIEKLKEGDILPVIIEEIRLEERKIALAPADSAEMKNWADYSKDNQQSLGALGEKLQKALAERKKA